MDLNNCSVEFRYSVEFRLRFANEASAEKALDALADMIQQKGEAYESFHSSIEYEEDFEYTFRGLDIDDVCLDLDELHYFGVFNEENTPGPDGEALAYALFHLVYNYGGSDMQSAVHLRSLTDYTLYSMNNRNFRRVDNEDIVDWAQPLD